MTSKVIEPIERHGSAARAADRVVGTVRAMTPMAAIGRRLVMLHASVGIVRLDVRVQSLGGVLAEHVASLAGELWGHVVDASEVFTLRDGDDPEVTAPDEAGGVVWLTVGTAIRGRCQRIEPVRVERDHPLSATDAAVAALVASSDGRRWLVEAGTDAPVQPVVRLLAG